MTNAQFTSKFFTSIDPRTELKIVTDIANHYGATAKDIYEELYDSEAEALIDYVTVNRQAVSLMINNFKRSL